MQQTLFKLFQDHDLLKRSWSANRGWKRNWNAINIVLSSLSRHPFCLLPGRNQAAKGLQPHLLSQRRTHVSRGTHVSLETLANLPSLGRHPFCLVPRRNQAAKGSTAPSSVWEGNTYYSGTTIQLVVVGLASIFSGAEAKSNCKRSTASSSVSEGNTCFQGITSQLVVVG